MKYSIKKDDKGNPMLFEEGYEVALGEPNSPELEFWFEIEHLKRELSMRDSISEEDYMLRKALGEELRAAKEKIQELESTLSKLDKENAKMLDRIQRLG